MRPVERRSEMVRRSGRLMVRAALIAAPIELVWVRLGPEHMQDLFAVVFMICAGAIMWMLCRRAGLDRKDAAKVAAVVAAGVLPLSVWVGSRRYGFDRGTAVLLALATVVIISWPFIWKEFKLEETSPPPASVTVESVS